MVGATRTLDGFRGEVIVTAEPTVWYQPGTGRISQASGGHHLLEPRAKRIDREFFFRADFTDSLLSLLKMSESTGC